MASKTDNKSKNSKSNSDEIEKTFGMKVLIFLGVVVSLLICIYLMNYFFVKKSYLKINISTDKKVETIKIAGTNTTILTQKYVSDLGYSMRYDIDTFKVFKYKNQDMFKYINAEKILVIVEKGAAPQNCNRTNEELFNSCVVKIDNYTNEYYITSNNKTYKVTVKTPGSPNYTEDIKSRINYMLNSFEINN